MKLLYTYLFPVQEQMLLIKLRFNLLLGFANNHAHHYFFIIQCYR